MLKKAIIYLIVLAGLIVLFLLVFISDSSNKGYPKTGKKSNYVNRKYLNLLGPPINEIGFNDVPHRLLPAGDSAIVMADTIIQIFSPDLKGGRKINVPAEHSTGNYYLYKSLDMLAGLNVSSREQYVLDKNGLISVTYNGFLLQGIFSGGLFYTIRLTPKKYIGNLSIETWDYKSDKRTTVLELNSFLHKEIQHCRECYESVLEGNFFLCGDDKIGFCFYRGGYYLTGNKDSFELHKTIIDFPFIEFREKEGEIGNGIKAMQCQPVKDILVQYSACSDNESVYILSNVIEEGKKERCVDVYNIKSNQYAYSFSIPNYNSGLPVEILKVKKFFIVVYDNGSLVSYSITQK